MSQQSTCRVCGTEFASRKELSTHIKAEHPEYYRESMKLTIATLPFMALSFPLYVLHDYFRDINSNLSNLLLILILPDAVVIGYIFYRMYHLPEKYKIATADKPETATRYKPNVNNLARLTKSKMLGGIGMLVLPCLFALAVCSYYAWVSFGIFVREKSFSASDALTLEGTILLVFFAGVFSAFFAILLYVWVLAKLRISAIERQQRREESKKELETENPPQQKH